jgi:hypothetical protein
MRNERKHIDFGKVLTVVLLSLQAVGVQFLLFIARPEFE